MKKRLVSMLLVLVMVVGLMPVVSVGAEETSNYIIPDEYILAKLKVEFENYVSKFDTDSKPEDLADGNKTIGNTKDGDIFYFGEQIMDDLGEISLNTAIRHDAGTGTATFYAVDMTNVDMSTISTTNVNTLLTNDAKLGTVTMIDGEGSWTTYYENRLRGFTASGTKGLFVKLATTGKYAGNHDKITLTYLKPGVDINDIVKKPVTSNTEFFVTADTLVESEMVYTDDENLTVVNMGIEPIRVNLEKYPGDPLTANINDVNCCYYIPVRTNSIPTSYDTITPSSGNALDIVAKKDGIFTIYHRWITDGRSLAVMEMNDDGTYTNQLTGKRTMVSGNILPESEALINVGYGYDAFELKAGKSYLVYATGFTGELFGYTFGNDSFVPSISGSTPDDGELNINKVTINGHGTAYGRFEITNSDGSTAKNKEVNYTIDGGDTKSVTTDANGYVCIGIDGITQSKNYNFTFSGNGIQPSSGVLSVTVTPLQFSSTYEAIISAGANAGIGIGIGGSIGNLGAEAKLAEVGVDGSIGRGLSLTQEYVDNKNKLTVTTKQNAEAALEAKAGLFAGVKAGPIAGVEASVGDIHGSASYGKTIGVSFEDDDFSLNNSEDVKNLSKFLISTSLESMGSNAATRYLIDKINAPVNAYEKENTVSLGAGVSLGVVSVGGENFEESLTLAGIDSSSVWSNSTTTKADNSKSYKSDVQAAVGVELLSLGAEINDDDASVGTGISLYGNGANKGVTFEAEKDENGKLSEISVSTENDKNTQIGWAERTKTEKFTISYSANAAQEIVQSYEPLNRFANGEKGYFSLYQMNKAIKAMTNSEQVGTYMTTAEHSKGVDVDFSASVQLFAELGAKVGISGIESYEYESENGIYDKAIYIQAKNDIADDVEDKFLSVSEIPGLIANEINNILSEFWDTVSGWISDVGDAIVDAGNAIVEGIKDTGKKLKVSISKLKESVGLMAVLAVDDETSVFSTSSLAITIGDPYVISVEDENGNILTDLSESPLLLSLSYTEEQLTAAGVSDLNDISILRWDEDKCVYVRMDGELDEANSCLKLEITKPGQYILAVDNCPPAITQFNASDSGNSPKISAIVSDMSGISEFRFSIDDAEILNTQNFEEYYDFTTAKFEYPTNGLSYGEHTAEIFAVDTFGNEIEQSISFIINTIVPSIIEISDLPETITEDTTVTARVAGEDISYVFLNTETTDTFGNTSLSSAEMSEENGVYSAKISNTPNGSTVSIWVNAYNVYGNKSESEKQESIFISGDVEPTETPTPTEVPTEQPSEQPTEQPSETPAPTGENAPVIGDYNGKITVNREVNDNTVTFTITAIEGKISDYADIKLFIAEYNSLYSPLEDIAIGINNIKDNKLIITAVIPNSKIYKFMLWDKNLTPIINVIKN